MTPEAIMHDPESRRILVAEVASGRVRPAAHPDWLVLSSDHAPWADSVLVELTRRPPYEQSAHAPQDHGTVIHLSPPGLREWRIAGERPRRQLVTPGDVHIRAVGVPKWVRWHEPSEILVVALAPSVVQHAVEAASAPPLIRTRIGWTWRRPWTAKCRRLRRAMRP